MDKIRKHMIFHGDVQCVGFRWNAKYTAQHYGITGWVKNQYNGTVEMEAEGSPADLAALVEELKNARWVHVEHIDETNIPTEGGYGFEIR